MTVPSPPPEPGGAPSLDPVIHEATRLGVVVVLNECEVADFNFLLGTLGLTRGNLSAHMSKLTAAGYVAEKKEFVDRKPHTDYRLTSKGRKAYAKYLKDWKAMTKPRLGKR